MRILLDAGADAQARTHLIEPPLSLFEDRQSLKQEFQGEKPDDMTVREIARPSIVAIPDEFIPTPGSPLPVVQEEILVGVDATLASYGFR